MDAAMVWRVWRRVLREAPVRSAMADGRLEQNAAALGLSPAEVEVAREYAAGQAGVRMFVESYRFRMVSSFFNALETTAPLTHRALMANDVDLRAAATAFLDEHEWRDFGPFVYAFGRLILDRLSDDDTAMSIDGLRELMALERAAIDVVTSAADAVTPTGDSPASPAGESPPDSEEPQDGAGQLWRARPWLGIHSTDRDLSQWLRDPRALGRTVPPRTPRTYVVYLPSLTADRRIVALPSRAAAALRILRDQPLASADLATALERAHPGDSLRDRDLLDRLAAMGLVDAPHDGTPARV
jgi:hypothetical protein